MEDNVQNILNDLFWNEYSVFGTNKKAEMADYEANLDIVACIRTEKDYDWLSNLFIGLCAINAFKTHPSRFP